LPWSKTIIQYFPALEMGFRDYYNVKLYDVYDTNWPNKASG